jgi:hypothetical protein
MHLLAVLRFHVVKIIVMKLCLFTDVLSLQGYSYVAPSVLFTENVVSDEIFKCTEDKRPNPANILSCKFKASGKMCPLHLKKSCFLNRVYILRDYGEKVTD